MKGIVIIILVVSTSFSTCDVSHFVNNEADHRSSGEDLVSTPSPPPRPYVFSYTAGRFPGHTDRAHSEVSDGSGVVRGAFSYIDPRQQIRSVEYVADKNGFHPILSHPDNGPEQSEAVQRATLNHYRLFNRIAEANANPDVNIVAPNDSASVAYAKRKHLSLYQKIAQEHARIGAERAAQHALLDSTSEKQIPVQVIEDY